MKELHHKEDSSAAVPAYTMTINWFDVTELKRDFKRQNMQRKNTEKQITWNNLGGSPFAHHLALRMSMVRAHISCMRIDKRSNTNNTYKNSDTVVSLTSTLSNERQPQDSQRKCACRTAQNTNKCDSKIAIKSCLIENHSMPRMKRICTEVEGVPPRSHSTLIYGMCLAELRWHFKLAIMLHMYRSCSWC